MRNERYSIQLRGLTMTFKYKWLIIRDTFWQLRECATDRVVLAIYRNACDPKHLFRVEVSNKHCCTYRTWRRRFESIEAAVTAVERYYGVASRVVVCNPIIRG